MVVRTSLPRHAIAAYCQQWEGHGGGEAAVFECCANGPFRDGNEAAHEAGADRRTRLGCARSQHLLERLVDAERVDE